MKNSDNIKIELVKEYRNRIEDFKEIYQEEVKLPIGSIDNYTEAYRRELEIVLNLEIEEFQILLNYIEEDIANFVGDKRELGFTPNASRLILGLLKEKFISKAPIEENQENIKILADSIYREDPWGQAQPKNDDELEMHREWWNIELWKHQTIKDYFYKKEYESAEAKPENYMEELTGVAKENADSFNERFKKEWPKLVPAILKTLDGKSLDEFKTKHGNVGLSFCKKIHQKYKGVPPSTLYKWLKKKNIQTRIIDVIQEERGKQ